jgi:ribosome biogenesis GTPase
LVEHLKGQIVKALAGFYYVDVGFGQGFSRVYQCRARGIFKKDGVTPLVGDHVLIVRQDEEEGVVDGILPRRNAFVRPPVANVDIFVVTVAAAEPAPSLDLIDRFLVTAEAADADAVVCINKDDLSPVQAKRIESVYKGLYPTVVMSAATGDGVPALSALIAGRSAAFAGASGVGKTSLIALLTGEGGLETGDVSAKTGRGRHTTRHVEIFALQDGARIYDTPGFSSFEAALAADMTEVQPDTLFPEFREYAGACRFRDCRHENEPDCAVRAALEKGGVKRSRYASYLKLLEEIRAVAPYGG